MFKGLFRIICKFNDKMISKLALSFVEVFASISSYTEYKSIQEIEFACEMLFDFVTAALTMGQSENKEKDNLRIEMKRVVSSQSVAVFQSKDPAQIMLLLTLKSLSYS